MHVTLTGATGFIGRALLRRLAEQGHSLAVVARHPSADLPDGASFYPWDALRDEFPEAALNRAQAVIHLAGEPVGQRWSSDVKERIRDSRIRGTRRLVEALSTMSHRPEVLISASAIGYYGDRGDEALAEGSAPGEGFLARTCVEWEQTASLAESLGMRVVTPRIGVVLSPEGGALAQMLPPFRWGAGGRLGRGQQWMSWIHREDAVALLVWAAQTPVVRGPLNLTAPNPVTNANFTAALSRTLRRPAVLPVPGPALKLLFGEMAGMLLGSQRVLPRKANANQFDFRFPELNAALSNLLGVS